MEFILWLIAVILVVYGIVTIVRGSVLFGIVLIIVGLLVGSDRFASVIQVFGNLASGAATTDASVNERLAMLTAAQQLFAASPVVGHGWAHFAALAYPLIGSAVVVLGGLFAPSSNAGFSD